MRGSPFQQPQALESIRQNDHYLRHRQALQDINNSPRIPTDLQPLRIFKAIQKQKDQLYQEATRDANILIENFRILKKLLSIRDGKLLSVSKADEWLASPSYRLKNEFRVRQMQSIEDENKRLARNLTKVNSSSNLQVENLERHFESAVRYKEQYLNSKRANASMATTPGKPGRIQLKVTELLNKELSGVERPCSISKKPSLPLTHNGSQQNSPRVVKKLSQVLSQDSIPVVEIKKDPDEIKKAPIVPDSLDTDIVISPNLLQEKSPKAQPERVRALSIARNESVTKIYKNKIQPRHVSPASFLPAINTNQTSILNTEMYEREKNRTISSRKKSIKEIEEQIKDFQSAQALQNFQNKVLRFPSPKRNNSIRIEVDGLQVKEQKIAPREEFFSVTNKNNKRGYFVEMNSEKKLNFSPSKKILPHSDRYIDINMLLHETITSNDSMIATIATEQNKDENAA